MTEPNLSVRQRKTWTPIERMKLASWRHLLDLARAYPEFAPAELRARLRDMVKPRASEVA